MLTRLGEHVGLVQTESGETDRTLLRAPLCAGPPAGRGLPPADVGLVWNLNGASDGVLLVPEWASPVSRADNKMRAQVVSAATQPDIDGACASVGHRYANCRSTSWERPWRSRGRLWATAGRMISKDQTMERNLLPLFGIPPSSIASFADRASCLRQRLAVLRGEHVIVIPRVTASKLVHLEERCELEPGDYVTLGLVGLELARIAGGSSQQIAFVTQNGADARSSLEPSHARRRCRQAGESPRDRVTDPRTAPEKEAPIPYSINVAQAKGDAAPHGSLGVWS
jgi:hypothetical protein